MRIVVSELYLEAGYSFHFSHVFINWIGQALSERIIPSQTFIKTYSKDYILRFALDASSTITELEIDGPAVHRRDKEVSFSITLPHPGGPCPAEPTAYERPVKQLFKAIIAELEKLGLDATRVTKDVPQLVQHFVSTPEMIFDHDWDKSQVAVQQKRKGATPA